MADLDPSLLALREGDRDRYLCALLMPEHARGAVAALYAFNLELARIPDLVSETQLGEIRLQWWHDLLASKEMSGGIGPVADALLQAVRDHDLPVEPLKNMVAARRFDLYHDPMPDRHTFEGYAGETASTLIQMSAAIVDPRAAVSTADAAGHAGIAHLVSGVVLLMPRHRAAGRVFVPADMMDAVGLDASGFLGGEDKAAMDRLVSVLVAYGREHLENARRHLEIADADFFGAFLPAALSRHVFNVAERLGGSIAYNPIMIPQWKRQWWLWRSARTGKL